ncbi:Flp family type IVb pilin [Pseudorhizobium endolithicum]|uniref:Flp family type IVb pilin n=1 Tax=Pseudorhizobium endolithicum TaxID=1191678 RepID=A0ABN7JKS4_9HYPH|nr:Flp family type IVb pilin [Pseudorhizobium endolithicum]CAD6432811.1 Flp family type IVb pilin [Rhizobium sp. Q54]CAD7034550.1 Flp family type IVb pilin [Pseudorhizobium endolithicum]
MRLLWSLSRRTDGATAIEYGLIAAIIAVVLVAGFGGLSDSLVDVFDTIEGYLTDAMS